MHSGFKNEQESLTQTLKRIVKCLETKPWGSWEALRQNLYGKIMRKWKKNFSLIQAMLIVNVAFCVARVICSSSFSGFESAKHNGCIKISVKVCRNVCSCTGEWRKSASVSLLPLWDKVFDTKFMNGGNFLCRISLLTSCFFVDCFISKNAADKWINTFHFLWELESVLQLLQL